MKAVVISTGKEINVSPDIPPVWNMVYKDEQGKMYMSYELRFEHDRHCETQA